MKTIRRKEQVTLASSVACAVLLVLSCLTVPAQDAGANKGTMKEGYLIKQSFDLGGHIVERGGNSGIYDTLVNMHTGPRILDATVNVHATDKAKHPLFDDLFTTNTGYGGDPENFTVLRVSKVKLYEFKGMFRRDRQYFDYDLLDNPLVPPGLTSNGYTFPQVLDSPHLFNTVRRMADADITLLPLSRVSFDVGYSGNVMEGPTLGSYHQGTEALLMQYWRNSTDAWRAGINWRVFPKTHLTFDEIIVHFKGDTNWQLAGLNLQLSNGAPVSLGFDNTSVPSCGNHRAPIVNGGTSPPTANATCNGFLQYTRSVPTRTLYPTEEFRFQTSDIKNIQMNGNVRYASANTNLPAYNEFFSGLESRTGTREITVTGSAKARRLNVNADYGIVWQFGPRWSLAEQFDLEEYRIPSFDNYLQTNSAGTSMLSPPGASGVPSVTSDAYFLGQNAMVDTIIGQWHAAPRASFSLGYRVRRTRIVRRSPDEDSFLIHQQGGLFAADLTPSPAWKIYGNIEIAYADNAYLQLQPRQLQDYQLRTIYRKSWAIVSGAFNDLERRNNVTYLNHFDHTRVGTVSAELTPNARVGVDLSYGYLDFFTRTDECYTATPAPANAVAANSLCVAAGTPYFSNGYYDAPTQNGSFGFNLTPVKRLNAGLGYQITAVNGVTTAINPRQVPGSLQSRFQSPYAHATWTIADGWGVRGDWNYYGYREDSPAGPTLPRTFHGNVFTGSVHYEF